MNRLGQSLTPEHQALPGVQPFLQYIGQSLLFCSDIPLVMSRAPGRLDVEDLL